VLRTAGFQNRPLLLSSIACNAAAMLKDEIYFLLHLQQHGRM
jgi:hypothetical protein